MYNLHFTLLESVWRETIGRLLECVTRASLGRSVSCLFLNDGDVRMYALDDEYGLL